jgi:uncharacterized protein (TIGR02996 family)
LTQNDAFIQAIIESPDDESLRLIYADWLEERGDPRGEFIRVQCQLANSPEGDPRRPELEARERDLLGTYEEQWAASVRPWVRTWRFQRGFVEDIKARLDTVLANVGNLFAAAPLRQVTFLPPEYKGPVKHVTFPPVFVEPLHRRLAAASPYLARMAAIDWAHTHIGDLGLAALANSPTPFRLSRLDLPQASIGDAGVQALADSPAFPRLTVLNLQWNSLGCLAAESLASSASLTHLVELDLSHTEVGDRGVEALAASPNLKSLTDLHLAGTAFGNLAARALADAPYLANLKRLDFRWCRFGRKARHTLRERFADIAQW